MNKNLAPSLLSGHERVPVLGADGSLSFLLNPCVNSSWQKEWKRRTERENWGKAKEEESMGRDGIDNCKKQYWEAPSIIGHWEREKMKDQESRISYVPQPLAFWLPVFKMPVDQYHFWCSSYSLESHFLRAESIVQTWNGAAPPLPRISLPTHNVPSIASCLQNSWRWGKEEKSQPTGRVTQMWVEVAIQRDSVLGHFVIKSLLIFSFEKNHWALVRCYAFTHALSHFILNTALRSMITIHILQIRKLKLKEEAWLI